MTFDDWDETFRPIVNTRDPGAGFDFGHGSVLMNSSDAHEVLQELKLSDDHLWTVLEADETLYVAHGYRWVNSLGFILTENAPQHPILNDILMD
jgi:hypothetical protein